MINTFILEKIFKSDIIENITQYNYITIEKSKIKIIILNDTNYALNINNVLSYGAKTRKNCLVMKPKGVRIHIYFKESFILSTITTLRLKKLNYLLNDE